MQVRRAYGLTIDRREAVALERVLYRCETSEMEPPVCRTDAAPSDVSVGTAPGGGALARYTDFPLATPPELTVQRRRTSVSQRFGVHKRWGHPANGPAGPGPLSIARGRTVGEPEAAVLTKEHREVGMIIRWRGEPPSSELGRTRS